MQQSDPLAPPAGRRRRFLLSFPSGLAGPAADKTKPDQALGHLEVFCFFLANAGSGRRWRRRWCGRRRRRQLRGRRAQHPDRDRTETASHRRVLALTFGPDFIHWRRSAESWPSVWPGRRLFFLINSPAAVAAWPRSARGSRRLERARDITQSGASATGPPCATPRSRPH